MDEHSLAIKIDSTDIKRGKLALVDFGKQAQKAETSADKLAKTFKKDAEEIEKSSNKVDNSFKKTTHQMSNMKKAVLGLATAFGVYKAAAFTKETALAAARYETLGIVLDRVGLTAGYSSGELNKTTTALQKSGISLASSRQGVIKLIQAHIDLANANKLSRIAQDAAVIGDLNSSEAFERLVYGIQTAQTEVLKSIGINVNFDNSYKKLAASLGVTANSLTENQKTQARLNAVIERGADISGVYEAAMTTASKKLNSFTRYVDDFKVEMGKAFGPAITKLVDDATEAMKEMTNTINDPESQKGIMEFAEGLSSIASSLISIGKASSSVVKVAGLRGLSGTFMQGMDLADQGLLDRQKFISSGFLERQKMVDEALKKSNQDLWIDKAKWEKKYNSVVKNRQEAEKNAAKRTIELAKETSEKEYQEAQKRNKKLTESQLRAARQAEQIRIEALTTAEEQFFIATQGQAAYEKNLILNQKELWVGLGFDKVNAEKWAAAEITKIEKEELERKKQLARETNMLYYSMADILESSLSNVFSDALRGELDSFEDYFSIFTDSLTSMWANMAAKMVITGELPAGMSAAGFGAAGVGIAGLSLLSKEISKQNKKAEEAYKELYAETVQGNQFTGSILGDINIKSESTTNALENILDVNVAGLDISRKMLSALEYVASNNERLAAFIGRNTGTITDPNFRSINEATVSNDLAAAINPYIQYMAKGLDSVLGTELGSTIGRLFGSTKKELIDSGIKVYSQTLNDILEGTFKGATYQTVKTSKRSFFKRSSSVSTSYGGLSGDIKSGFAAMFEGIGEALFAGAETFGISTNKKLRVSSQNISLKGQTSEQAAETINNFVSKTADSWAKTMLKGTTLLADYQLAGEGAFETYVRLANETEYFSSSMDAMGVTINATGVSLVRISQNMLELSGGIENLQSSMSSYYDSFYSDIEKQQNVYDSLSKSFTDLDMIFPSTREGFKNIVSALDLTNELDQERYVSLINLSGAAGQFYDYMESISSAFTNAKNSLLGQISGDGSYSRVRTQLMDALAAARGGDLGQAVSVSGNLSVLSGGPRGIQTEVEFNRERAQTLNALTELEKLTGGQLSNEELMVSNLETQVTQLKDANETLININNSLNGNSTLPAVVDTSTGQTVMIDTSGIIDALAELQESIFKTNYEVAKNTKKIYDIIDRFDIVGLPPERAA